MCVYLTKGGTTMRGEKRKLIAIVMALALVLVEVVVFFLSFVTLLDF